MKTILTYFALFLCIIGCTSIDNLSEDVSIKDFKVISWSPDKIIIGTPEITSDTIYIPIEYGKYEFPLDIEVDVTTAKGNERIYGIENGEPIRFENISQNVEFVVTSESGYSKSYFIAPKEIALNEDTDIYAPVSILEPIIINDNLISTNENSLEMVIFNQGYPISVTPSFSTESLSKIERYSADGTKWEEFKNGETNLTFSSAETKYKFEVKAASGKSKEWNIGTTIIETTPVSGTTQINYKELSTNISSSEIKLIRNDVDIENGIVSIILDTSEVTQNSYFPIDIEVNIPNSEWADIVGINETFSYSFKSWSDTTTLIVFDIIGMKASKWRFEIKPYGEVKNYELENFKIVNFTTNKYLGRDNLVQSELPPVIDNQNRVVTIFYKSHINGPIFEDWAASYQVEMGAEDRVEASSDTFNWEVAKGSGFLASVTTEEIKTELAQAKPFTLTFSDGTEQQWSVKLQLEDNEASSESYITALSILNTIPNYTTFGTPSYFITVEGAENIIQFNLGDRYDFPLTINAEFTLSPNATIDLKDGITFNTENDIVPISVTSHNGASTTTYKARVNVPQIVEASDILSATFGEMPSGVSILETDIDTENSIVTLSVECSDNNYPLEIPINELVLSEGATLAQPVESIIFNNSDALASIIVQSPSQSRRTWYFKIKYYQQIEGADIDSWNGIYPLAPWSSANMEALVSVKNTKPVTGSSGKDGDFAAELTTGSTFGQLASGTLFTGWFDQDNAISFGLTDPTILTWFGIPFTPDATIKGVTFDISYSAADANTDWGSVSITLINWDGSSSFEFHGDRPKSGNDPLQGIEPHPNNTALSSAKSTLFVGNVSGKTAYGDQIGLTIPAGEWQKEVFLPIDGDVKFTHIAITFASSAYGDYFIGSLGSVMRVDNVKIVY